jgi:toxin-antitoxin system PIN domain toxin
MTVLADSSVLIALYVPEHVHHPQAVAWRDSLRGHYATCPITQGALVRFAVREGAAPKDVRLLLQDLEDDAAHEFWGDDIRYIDVPLWGVIGHRQVTDAYLAQLARHRGGTLATFDAGLALTHPDVAQVISQGPNP